MNININPKLIDLLNSTATGQGLTPEQFITHHIEKYLVGNLRNQTSEKLKELTVDEVATIKTSVEAVIEAKKPPVVVEEVVVE